MNPEQIQKLNEVYQFMQAMKARSSIPLEVDRALRDRLNLSSVPTAALSAKSATSEDQAVDEGGAGTYAVMGDPIGFLDITIGATTYYVPYFNA